MRALSAIYWFFVIIICFYGNFAFYDGAAYAIVLITVITIIAFFISYKISGFEFDSWLHEVVLSGVDKLSMSITSLSVPGEPTTRLWWMPVFEMYFGLTIKFINPACLLWILCENASVDLEESYAG